MRKIITTLLIITILAVASPCMAADEYSGSIIYLIEAQAVNVTSDITAPTNLSVDAAEEILPDTLKPYAQNFVDGEAEHGVNMLFVMAIAKQETSSGTAGVGASKNNLFGVKGGSGYRYFEDFGASIDNQFRLIREVYFDNGRITIGSIAQIYCVPPEHWQSAVSGIFAEYVERAEELACDI